jgi:endonuclease YncB( thermonuclease family)
MSALVLGCSQSSQFAQDSEQIANPDTTSGLTPDAPAYLDDEWTEAPAGWCDNPFHTAPVVSVVDGDTLVVGLDTRVRFIGVDAPEILDDDCWSGEAKHELKALSPPGTLVCLMPDDNSSDKDNFGRLLRYVYIQKEGKWVMENVRLIRIGAAQAYSSFLKKKMYKDDILKAESLARVENLGGWAACSDWN